MVKSGHRTTRFAIWVCWIPLQNLKFMMLDEKRIYYYYLKLYLVNFVEIFLIYIGAMGSSIVMFSFLVQSVVIH